MEKYILDHYRTFGRSSYPGLYLDMLRNELPDDIREIGLLVRKSVIHRLLLRIGNRFSNSDMRYGDITRLHWSIQCEDDYLTTSSAMLAELYRRDGRGFTLDRLTENKLVLTCRYVALLMATILKAKGYPARVRSGFDPYASPKKGVACDHWITQYWLDSDQRWVTIDVDCSIEPSLDFDPYDMPEGTFIYSADAWFDVREYRKPASYYWNASGNDGSMVIAWELFYDFHCLMNSEPIYAHGPDFVKTENWPKMCVDDFIDIDRLAIYMKDPDKNFYQLRQLWEFCRKYRLLSGGLLP